MVGSTANSDFLDKHFAYKQPSNFFFFSNKKMLEAIK